MTYDQIRIFFKLDITIGTTLSFDTISFDFPLPNIDYAWVTTRYTSGQVPVGTPTINQGERAAINFMAAFIADYNSTGLFEVTRIDSDVIIKSTDPSITFLNFSASVGTNRIDHEVTEYVGTPYTLTSLLFSAATTNPACSHYKVTIETNLLTVSVSGTVVIPANTDNPFSFELLRGQAFNITLTDDDGQTINTIKTSDQVPKLLNSGFFDMSVTSSPSGGTLTITPNQTFGISTIQYSLNNVDWQSDNFFTGLLEGSHTLYVRDNFGCSFSQSFSIDAFNKVRVQYFLMPKSNSIRFANRITWGDAANYKTDDNSLSCEADVKKPYKEIQQFQTADVITTQYRSNYTENLAVVIKEDGTEDSYPVTKETNNMGLKDKRDCRKYNLGNGKTGLYFTTGNIYDFDTSADTGDDYILNGLLPEWAIVGTSVNLGSGWYVIEDVIFDESVNAQVCVITNVYTGSDVVVQVGALYDIENYEEYEFTIDFSIYVNQTIKVRVNANDDDFVNIIQLSEDIEVKVRHVGTYDITYKNSKNTDINYSRGLAHKMRHLMEKVSGLPEEDSETSKTDTTARLLNSTVYELDKFLFSPVTKQMMRKIVLALSHDTIMINGETYVKNDSIEVSDALEDTNLYEITATMIKGSNAFSSKVTQGSNIISGGDTEIPGLIESDSGYIKY